VERDLPMAVALMNRMADALARYAAPEPVELQSMLKALQDSAESTRRTGSGDAVDASASVDGDAGPDGSGEAVEGEASGSGDAPADGGAA
jgi:hypothetical protein